MPVFARLWPVKVRVRVSFTTGAVRSAILATAGRLVNFGVRPERQIALTSLAAESLKEEGWSSNKFCQSYVQMCSLWHKTNKTNK